MCNFNIIVCTKDRAMQLDLFIRSFIRHVVSAEEYKINIIGNITDIDYENAYDKLWIKHEWIIGKFVEDNFYGGFKQSLLRLIDETSKYIVFFMDDNVFLRDFEFCDSQHELFESNSNILCRSLRMNPHLRYCYPTDKPMKPPLMHRNVWDWRGASQDYGYPMSLDGHIFRMDDLLPMLKSYNYDNPNTLEGTLASHPIRTKPHMVCYDKSIIVNTPINKVQTVNKNRSGVVNTKYLNDKYMQGEIIDLTTFDNYNNNACHEEISIKLISEP